LSWRAGGLTTGVSAGVFRGRYFVTGQCLLTEAVSDRPPGCQGELELEVGQEEELEELEEEEA